MARNDHIVNTSFSAEYIIAFIYAISCSLMLQIFRAFSMFNQVSSNYL